MMMFMPESPMFYMVKRNEEAAKKSMRFFRGPDYEKIDDELALFKVSVLFIIRSSPYLFTHRIYEKFYLNLNVIRFTNFLIVFNCLSLLLTFWLTKNSIRI